ncbi:MAG: hypothetical protein K6G30_09070, partial [Acetatifactor sp.]|nr:hypothetical protein [Acetatifactor sp.]
MDTMQKYQYDEQKDQSAAYNGQIQADFSFQFDKPTEEIRIMKGQTVISDKLAEAFMMPRSGEYMDILKKQAISAMSDEEIKRIIAKEILCGGAQSVEEVVKLKNFMENPELEDEVSGEEEKALVQEMSEEDVADFLKMLNASFRETIAKEELKMKESLTELDKKAID